MLSVALVAPTTARAQDTNVVMAPAAPVGESACGSGSLTTARAAIALPEDADSASGLAGVRWAPERTMSPEPSRVAAAREALRSNDLGSMQEAALTDLVAGGATDDAAGAGAAATACAASPAPLPTNLAIAIATGTRGETAHLATVPLPPGVDVSVAQQADSDDRIANALFGSS